MRTAALSLRIQRVEFIAVIAASLALAISALAIAAELSAIKVPLSCFGDANVHGATGSSAPGCIASLDAFAAVNTDQADRLFAVLVGFPVVAGLLLGVPIGGREIEQGTIVLPWTLSGRRRRWLFRRTMVAIGVLAISLVPLALAADSLETARNPLVGADRSFADDGLRGGILVARGLAGLAMGALIGLLVGRQLPAVIIGLFAAVVLVIADVEAGNAWSRTVASYVPQAEARLGDRSILSALRSRTDGTIVSQRDIVKLIPPRPDLPPDSIDDQWIGEHYDEVLLIVPGSRYGEQVVVRAFGLIAWSMVSFLGGSIVVQRRRPG